MEVAKSEKPVILTVDDQQTVLTRLRETLKNDYTVCPVTSGPAALEFLKSHHADLIVLDYYMPEMSGFDVLTILQNDEKLKSIPVIFLTGSENDEDEIAALKMGAVDYLLKEPFKPHALITRINLQLELFRHRHHLEELVEQKTQDLSEANRKLSQRDRVTLEMLAQASDLRDHDTGAHLDRTTGYAKIIVDDLLAAPHEDYGLTPESGTDIVDAMKLHDLGKLAMPDAVLLKPGRLTKEEFDVIKTHPTYGYEMLKDAIASMGEDSLLYTAGDIAYGHHEKWNGSGYPQGSSGTDIPLSARISAISDVFDALTSARPYKPAFSPRKAFEIMYDDAGTHFDPYLIEVLRRHEKDFETIVKTLGDAALVDEDDDLKDVEQR
ncbi:MAG: response regulator [Coriobacteriia bacterium]|nr:response regulator [Coriobacteriia bacterium]